VVLGFNLNFRLHAYKFRFRALESIDFPQNKAGNVIRGALWPLISPVCESSVHRPSGLSQPPRPFVIRAAHLDGKRLAPGNTFCVALHLFDTRPQLIEGFVSAFEQLSDDGLGPRRGRVALLNPDAQPEQVSIDLDAHEPASRCTLAFETPVELKGQSGEDISFGLLFSRVRDRVATLRALYGEGSIAIDFRAKAVRAGFVKTSRCDLVWNDISRRSSRTGQVHGIGGFTGSAVYEGDLQEFVPWLRAACWTGLGRHTVWGNGVIEASFE
jgi:hypothetical protein